MTLVLSYFLLPEYGFTTSLTQQDTPLINHFLYPLSHANIFHLAANVVCILAMPCPLKLHITYPIAVLASFIPSPTLYDLFSVGGSMNPTMGFSGILFAAVGLSWGRIHRFRDMVYRNRIFLILPALFPNINALIHLYCLVLAYIYASKTAPVPKKSILGKKTNL